MSGGGCVFFCRVSGHLAGGVPGFLAGLELCVPRFGCLVQKALGA